MSHPDDPSPESFQQLLYQSLTGFQTLVEKNVDGMLVIDRQGRVAYANQAMSTLFGGRSFDRGMAFGFPVVAGDTTELDILLPDFQRRVAEMRVSAISWEGEPALLASLRDITERKATEEALYKARHAADKANRAKSAFLATMSHEIRTPMTAIIGMAELVDGQSSEEERQEAMAIIRESGHALLTLINDILDLAKIEAGEFIPRHEIFSPRDLLASVWAIMRIPAERDKGLQLIQILGPEVPDAVRADHRRIRQVLINLVGNAIKFTAAGRVEIAVQVDPNATDGSHLLFSVSDTGIGMAPEHLDKVFDPFVQAEETTWNQYGGTGLGLAISKRLVQVMNGKIWAISTPGQGSTFFFTVEAPVESLDPQEHPTPMDPTILAMPHIYSPAKWVAMLHQGSCPELAPDTRILVVEDDPVNQLVLLKMLKRFGVMPDLAHNGREALDLVAHQAYSLIFMDVLMPELDGLETTRRIRQGEKNRQPCPIVAMTAFVMEGDREKCLAAGMNDYLAKPVRGQDLRGILSRWIGVKPSPTITPLPAGVSCQEPALDLRQLKGFFDEFDDREESVSVVQVFLMGMQEGMANIKSAVENQDKHAMERAAHKLKSSSRQIGANGVGLLAEKLEREGRSDHPMAHALPLVASLEMEAARARMAILEAIDQVL